jgi:hypothetical protein
MMLIGDHWSYKRCLFTEGVSGLSETRTGDIGKATYLPWRLKVLSFLYLLGIVAVCGIKTKPFRVSEGQQKVSN